MDAEIKKIKILLIEDEDYDIERVNNTIEPFAEKLMITTTVKNGNEALRLIRSQPGMYDVVIMDYQISSGIMGEELISKIRMEEPSLQIIVITKLTININNLEFANNLVNAGAFWYCTKYPGDMDYIYQPTDFAMAIYNAFQKKQLLLEKAKSSKKINDGINEILETKRIIGISPQIKKLEERIEKCAGSSANILIQGESGTGKELVAANIHYRSSRKYENFIAVNCGSLPNDLIESELFGYEKGSFTGANKNKAGIFELADNGTVFLDEIADLPLNAQVKLLRVLQEGEIEKIGRTGRLKVNVRIIAASNRSLAKEVEAGRFREDLFFRLNVIVVNVPGLAEREADVELLTNHFLGIFAFEMKRNKPSVSPEALKLLNEYRWPGNIRELKNVIQRMLFDAGEKITPEIVRSSVAGAPVKNLSDKDLFETLFEKEGVIAFNESKFLFRKKYISYVRSICESDAEASEKLCLAPPNFHRVCKEAGIK